MKIIPPKLKILCGFKADEDVTIDQIIAALEKKNQKQPTTQISNALANIRNRQSKFQGLLKERAHTFPNESYDDCFRAVINSEEGKQLFAQMHQPGPTDDKSFANQAEPTEKFDPIVKEKAKREFQDLVDRLKLEGHHADAWQFASNVHSLGKKLYQTWKDQADLEKRETLVREQRARGGSGGVGLTSEAVAR